MKKILTLLLTTLGLTSACGQKNYDDSNVDDFAQIIAKNNAIVLDARTIEEYAEGHIGNALNIDVLKDDFLEKARQQLQKDKTIAVYCRSGRRSAKACSLLAAEGYKCVNLVGGFMAWEKAGMAVKKDAFETDVFNTQSGKTIIFHALMHASIWIEYNGKNIYIDPVGKLGDRSVDYSNMPKADYLFVTHEHPDHFDRETIAQLMCGNTNIVTNKRCSDMLGGGKAMVNGDSIVMGNDMSVRAVAAYNTTEANKKFHPKGRDNGFILTLDDVRIYVAGDTEDIPEMATLTNIDIAFLPCNQPFTMTPQQLAHASKMIMPKVLFPYHYGQTDIGIVTELLKDENIDIRIRHYE